MISLSIIIAFFLILAMVYPLILIMVSIAGRYEKRRLELRGGGWNKGDMDDVDQRTDRLKEIFFNLSVFIIFFIVAPVVVFCLFA